jgi:hypothetical protein
MVKLIYNEFESHRERTKNVSVQKSNSNPVGLNLQTHMQYLSSLDPKDRMSYGNHLVSVVSRS